MDGLYFYWIFWAFWIIAAFFMKKTLARMLLIQWILAAISLSVFSFSIAAIKVSLSALFLFFTALMAILATKEKKRPYSLFAVFIVTLAFAGFQLIELYDPVVFLFNRTWMMAAYLTLLVVLLEKDVRMQMAVLIAGAIYGDLLLAVLLRNIAEYHAGSLATLDVIALVLAVLYALHIFKEASFALEEQFKQLERGKQNTP